MADTGKALASGGGNASGGDPEKGLVSLVNKSLEGDKNAILALGLIVHNFDFKSIRGMFNPGEDCLYALNVIAKCMPKDRDAVCFLKDKNNPLNAVFSEGKERRRAVV